MNRTIAKFISVVVVAIATLMPIASNAQTIDYTHTAFNCQWLENEYNRILEANEMRIAKEEDSFLDIDINANFNPKLIFAEVITFPLYIIESMTDFEPKVVTVKPIGATINFSGSIHDVAKAANGKNCYKFYDQYYQAERAGELSHIEPAPIMSPLASE